MATDHRSFREPVVAVTIGIPTRNRAQLLRVALASALRQTHPNVQIIVSDNDSNDHTAAVVADLAGPHVSYVRQPPGGSACNNFAWLLGQARTPLFVWLADDDEMDAGYVEACSAVLGAHPDWVAACGRTEYVDAAGKTLYTEDKANLDVLEDSPALRTLRWMNMVGSNSLYYGVMRTDVARSIPIRDGFADDWVFTASLAFAGKAGVAPGARMSRRIDGTSADISALIAAAGLAGPAAKWPYRMPAYQLARDAMSARGVFRGASAISRSTVAVGGIAVMERRFRLSGVRARWKGAFAKTRNIGQSR